MASSEPDVSSLGETGEAAKKHAHVPDDEEAQQTKRWRSVTWNEDGHYSVKFGEVMNQRYKIRSVIGKGSFAQVVEASDLDRGVKVAIKIVKPEKSKKAAKEIKLLKMMNSEDTDGKYIVKLLDTIDFKSHSCLVLELFPYTLRMRLSANIGSAKFIKAVGHQLCSALQFMARPDINVIHRDLKPDNILMRSDDYYPVKLIDFGNACLQGSEENLQEFNVQTMLYRAPEVILELLYDLAIDMWSLGCILMEMCIGSVYFPGSSEFNQMQRIVEARGIPPKHMLDASTKTEYFFEQQPDNTYKLKPPETENWQPSLLPGANVLGTETMTRWSEHQGSGSEPEDFMFLDLVKRMLDYDPATRITPEYAAQHSFFSQTYRTNSASASQSSSSSATASTSSSSSTDA